MPRTAEARNFAENVGGGTAMGARPDLREGVEDAINPEAGLQGHWRHQQSQLEVLPAEDRRQPFWDVPTLGEQPTHPPVLVAQVRYTAERFYAEHWPYERTIEGA